MKTFLIAELQNPQSVRKAESVICANLAAAKRAAMSDFEFLRGWCNDDWHWAGIVVKMLDEEGEETGEEESVWGFDSCSDEYMHSEAERMAEYLAAGVMRTILFKRQGESVRASLIDARGV